VLLQVKRDIQHVVVKTILSALPANQHAYKVPRPLLCPYPPPSPRSRVAAHDLCNARALSFFSLSHKTHIKHTQVSFPESRDSVGASCFTVMGFDVMLDAEANAWLIETNELPSFETDSPLDLEIKLSIVKEALAMVVCVRSCLCMRARAYLDAIVFHCARA